MKEGTNTTKIQRKYKNSLEDNDNFWREEGKRIDWVNNYTKIKDVKYSKNEVDIKTNIKTVLLFDAIKPEIEKRIPMISITLILLLRKNAKTVNIIANP